MTTKLVLYLFSQMLEVFGGLDLPLLPEWVEDFDNDF